MKKLISFLMAVVMVATFMVTPTLAAENPAISVSSETAEAGETVKLSVSITNNTVGFVSGKVTLTYDESVLKLTEMENVMFQGFANPDTGMANHSSVTPVKGNGVLVTATFTVAEDAAPGSYAVAATVTGMRDDAGNLLSVAGTSGTVTVEEPVHEHTWGKWEVTQAPTCTEKGVETRTCACGEKETREVAAKGHTFGEWKVTKAATCTAKGEETRTCACGEKETREIAAKGHTFGEWKVTKAATCTTKGEETRTCACGEKETREVAMLAHNLEMKYDENNHWTECKDCEFVGEKSAHTFENNGYCECGYKKPVVEKPGDAELDDVPETGDITPMLNMTAVAVVAVVAALAYVLKRKTVK